MRMCVCVWERCAQSNYVIRAEPSGHLCGRLIQSAKDRLLDLFSPSLLVCGLLDTLWIGTTISYCLSPCRALMLHPLQQKGGQTVMRHNREQDDGSWGDTFEAVFIEHVLTENNQLVPEKKKRKLTLPSFRCWGICTTLYSEVRGGTIIKSGRIQAAVCWVCLWHLKTKLIRRIDPWHTSLAHPTASCSL